MITLITSKRTPPPPRRGTFSHRLKQFAAPCTAFLFALLLAACPNPGDTTPGGGTSTGGTNGGGTTPGGGGGTRPAVTTTTVTGTVQDASRPGVGLPGAKVTASTTPEITTITDSGGAFRFEVTHSGSLSFTLSAEKACHETAPARSITLTDNTAYNAKAIELPPAPEPQGNDRFSLTPPGGPTYTLTIADCVRTIAAGEFTPTSVKVTDPDNPAAQIDAVTKLDGLLGSSSSNPNRKVTAIILPESLVRIGEKAFFDHQNVSTKLTIPASVESIGKSSFQSVGSVHEGQRSLEIPLNSKLREIGDSAFSYSIVGSISPLPPTLETIGEGAFLQPAVGIRSTNFIIAENVTSIGTGAFAITGPSARPRVRGKLTIRSPELKRTPADKTQDKTGPLGNYLFKVVTSGTKPVNPFTTIALHEAVFDSYTKDDLEFIFGTGGRYVDIQDETRVLIPE